MAAKHREHRQKWIASIKTHYGCRLCGEKHIECLTFHHINPETKNRQVCKSKSTFSKRVLREELIKCIVLCLNCHALTEAGLLIVDKKMLCKIDEAFRICE